MTTEYFPFFVIPLLIYTYFWINPTALAAFLEGFIRLITEIYLGYKAWRLEYETKRSYRYYLRESRKIAEASGMSDNLLKAYYEVYGEQDKKTLYNIEKEIFEQRNRDIEDSLRNSLLF